MRRAIAIDFDGCICQSEYPEIGEPNWHVIEEARRNKTADCRAAGRRTEDRTFCPPAVARMGRMGQ